MAGHSQAETTQNFSRLEKICWVINQLERVEIGNLDDGLLYCNYVNNLFPNLISMDNVGANIEVNFQILQTALRKIGFVRPFAVDELIGRNESAHNNLIAVLKGLAERLLRILDPLRGSVGPGGGGCSFSTMIAHQPDQYLFADLAVKTEDMTSADLKEQYELLRGRINTLQTFCTNDDNWGSDQMVSKETVLNILHRVENGNGSPNSTHPQTDRCSPTTPLKTSTINEYKKRCSEYEEIISQQAVKIKKLEVLNAELSKVQHNKMMLSLFLEGDIEHLNKIPRNPENDRTFIREAIERLYRNDMDRVKLISLKGRKPRNVDVNDEVQRSRIKRPMSPEKLTVLTNLFHNRVGSCEIRRKTLNNCISNSLLKISEKCVNHERRLNARTQRDLVS